MSAGCWIVTRCDQWGRRFIVHRAASELLATQWSNANPSSSAKSANEVSFSKRAVLVGTNERRTAKYLKTNPDQGSLL